MKTIACNTYDFEQLRDAEAVYVDKTDILARLIQDKGNILYFISRPRRFGKSLMISTLDCIFRGKRELFKGLKIDSLDYDWQTYPILKFDFSEIKTDTFEEFEARFKQHVINSLREAGVEPDKNYSPGMMFSVAITELAQRYGKHVVILIDEYDAPVTYALREPQRAKAILEVLANFHIQIKANVGKIRFLMLTGAMSYLRFFGSYSFNNLTDLTLAPQTATLLGYTEEELSEFFLEHMEAHAQVMGLSYEDYREKLKYWYNGYRFSPHLESRVYNPIAIAQTLPSRYADFHPTWSKTGRPSMLMNYLGSKPTLAENYELIKGQLEEIFDASDLAALNPITMLYQAGYLTIKDFDGMYYTLGIPNEEIRRDLNTLLIELATKEKATLHLYPVAFNLQEHDFDKVEQHLKALYARLPYGSKETHFRASEASYVRVMMATLMSGGYILRPEDQHSRGRSDLVAEGRSGIFIFEFKVDKSAQEALGQIREKNYVAPYLAQPKPIFALGLNFSSETSQLTDFAVEQLK